MTFQQLLDSIPIQAWVGVGVAFTGFLAAIFFFLRWVLFTYIPKVLEDRITAAQEERKNATESNRAKLELERLDRQVEAQAQNNNQELVRILAAQLAETHKDGVNQARELQAGFNRQSEQYLKHLASIDTSFQGYQVIAASTLEILKTHEEKTEVSEIRGAKMMSQNEETHRKLSDLASDLAEVSQKLESVVLGRIGDRKILDEIKGAVDGVISRIKHIEDAVTAPQLETPIASDAPKMNAVVTTTTVTEVSEASKEFTGKETSE